MQIFINCCILLSSVLTSRYGRTVTSLSVPTYSFICWFIPFSSSSWTSGKHCSGLHFQNFVILKISCNWNYTNYNFLKIDFRTTQHVFFHILVALSIVFYDYNSMIEVYHCLSIHSFKDIWIFPVWGYSKYMFVKS